MNLLARSGGALSRFAHLAGMGRPVASEGEPQPAPQPEPTPPQPTEPGQEPEPPANPQNVPEPAAQPQGEPQGRSQAEARAYSQGFLAAQQRAATILSHGAAAGNLPLACELACGNQLPTAQALALLNAGVAGLQAQQPARTTLDDRMRGQPARGLGPDAGASTVQDPDSPEAVAAAILAARDKVRGVTANGKA